MPLQRGRESLLREPQHLLCCTLVEERERVVNCNVSNFVFISSIEAFLNRLDMVFAISCCTNNHITGFITMLSLISISIRDTFIADHWSNTNCSSSFQQLVLKAFALCIPLPWMWVRAAVATWHQWWAKDSARMWGMSSTFMMTRIAAGNRC